MADLRTQVAPLPQIVELVSNTVTGRVNDTGVQQTARIITRQNAEQVVELRQTEMGGTGSELGKTRQGEEVVVLPQIQKRLAEINEMLKRANRKIFFDVEENPSGVSVRILNSDTGEVLHELAPDDILKLSSRLRDLRGVIFETQG